MVIQPGLPAFSNNWYAKIVGIVNESGINNRSKSIYFLFNYWAKSQKIQECEASLTNRRI